MKIPLLILMISLGAAPLPASDSPNLLHPTHPPRALKPPPLEGRIDTRMILIRHDELKRTFHELMASRTAGLGHRHPTVLVLRTRLSILADDERMSRIKLRHRLLELEKLRDYYTSSRLGTPLQHTELHRQTTELTTTLAKLDQPLE